MKKIILTAVILGLAGGAYAGTAIEQLGNIPGLGLKNSPALSTPVPAPDRAAAKMGEVIMTYTSDIYGTESTSLWQDTEQATTAMNNFVAVLEKSQIPVLEARLLESKRSFQICYLAKPRELSVEKYTSRIYGTESTSLTQDTAQATAAMDGWVTTLEKLQIPVFEARLSGNKRGFQISYLAKPREFSIEKYTSRVYGTQSTSLSQDTAQATAAMDNYVAKLKSAQIPILEYGLFNDKRGFTIVYLGPPANQHQHPMD